MMVSLLVCEINTNNTAISAININFIVITIIFSTNQEGAGPTISALPGWFRQMHILQSGLPSTWLLFSSYRRSCCKYYKVICPPLDRFCLLIKDHFAYITKRTSLHLIAFVFSSKIVQPHIGEQTPGRGNWLRSATILDSTLLKARSHFLFAICPFSSSCAVIFVISEDDAFSVSIFALSSSSTLLSSRSLSSLSMFVFLLLLTLLTNQVSPYHYARVVEELVDNLYSKRSCRDDFYS